MDNKTAARTLGRNLAKLRNAAGLTQEALAEHADISARYVQDLEAGIYVPTVFIAERLRKSLDCPWEILLKGCMSGATNKSTRKASK